MPAVTGSVSTNAVSLTARCAGGITAPTLTDNSANITTSAWTAGSNGTTTGTTFALSPSALTTPSPTTVADGIVADVNTNTATTTVSAANTAGVVTLTANTWGTTGNTTTLAQNATSGVTVSGATLSGGANATVTGNQFRIDNNNTDSHHGSPPPRRYDRWRHSGRHGQLYRRRWLRSRQLQAERRAIASRPPRL